MSGGMAGFLDESTGDLVKHIRAATGVSAQVGVGVNARIFAEQARLGAARPHIVYTQVDGHSPKDLSGLDGCAELTLHLYAYSDTQPNSRLLANAILYRMAGSDHSRWADSTYVHVCNGGIVDTGVQAAKDQSDKKLYWTRLVMRLVISDW